MARVGYFHGINTFLECVAWYLWQSCRPLNRFCLSSSHKAWDVAYQPLPGPGQCGHASLKEVGVSWGNPDNCGTWFWLVADSFTDSLDVFKEWWVLFIVVYSVSSLDSCSSFGCTCWTIQCLCFSFPLLTLTWGRAGFNRQTSDNCRGEMNRHSSNERYNLGGAEGKNCLYVSRNCVVFDTLTTAIFQKAKELWWDKSLEAVRNWDRIIFLQLWPIITQTAVLP